MATSALLFFRQLLASSRYKHWLRYDSLVSLRDLDLDFSDTSDANYILAENWSYSNSDEEEACAPSAAASSEPVPPVWSLDCSDRLVVVGCANGRIEVWEARTGAFR